jgi:hypothetical protein
LASSYGLVASITIYPSLPAPFPPFYFAGIARREAQAG